MAKERIQAKPLRSPELTQVQAQPVSTLYNPMVRKPEESNDLLELGRALSQVEPSIGQFLDTKVQQYTEEEMKKGREAQLRNKLAFKDAVNKGSIPAGASPYFVRGYREQEQRLNGHTFDLTLRQAWAQSPIREEDDPEAFQAWMQKFTSEYVDDKQLGGTPFFDVFNQQVQASQNNLFSQHVGYRQQEIERKVIENTKTEVFATLDSAGMFKDDESMVKTIEWKVNEQVQNGLNGTVANRLTVDAIIEKAVEKSDPGILQLLDKVNTGNGPLGNTAYGREESRKAEDAIYRGIAQKSVQSQKKHEDNIKTATATFSREAVTRGLEDPTANIQDVLEKANAVDPEVFEKVVNAHKKATSFKTDVIEDPEHVNFVTRNAIFNENYTLTDLINDSKGDDGRQLLNKETVSRLYNDIQEKTQDPKWMRGGWYQKDLDDIDDFVVLAIGGQKTGGDTYTASDGSTFSFGGKVTKTPEMIKQTIAARNDYYDMLRANRGIAKDSQDLQQRMNQAKKIILERYTPKEALVAPKATPAPGGSSKPTAQPEVPVAPKDDPEFQKFMKQLRQQSNETKKDK